MDDTQQYYVYSYLRSQGSKNGPVSSPYYIGKGKGVRAYYKSGKNRIKPPVNKKDIVIIADDMTERDALQAEMLLIYQYGRIDKGTGYLRNRTDGGEGLAGLVRTEKHRERIGAALRGIAKTEDHRKKVSDALKGRTLSEEHRLNSADGHRGVRASEERRKKIGDANRGKRRSEEQRKAISERLKGRPTWNKGLKGVQQATHETRVAMKMAQQRRRAQEASAKEVTGVIQ
jgi:NUMOD3 motif